MRRPLCTLLAFLRSRHSGARSVGVAGLGRRHHALSQRDGPVCIGTAPGDRHRSPGRHAGGGRGRRRGALRGDGRLVGAHGRRAHERRVRHLLPPPLVARGASGRARGGRRADRRGRDDRDPLGRGAAPPLRSPRRRNAPRLPRSAGLPAGVARDSRTRPAARGARARARTGTARGRAGTRSALGARTAARTPCPTRVTAHRAPRGTAHRAARGTTPRAGRGTAHRVARGSRERTSCGTCLRASVAHRARRGSASARRGSRRRITTGIDG